MEGNCVQVNWPFFVHCPDLQIYLFQILHPFSVATDLLQGDKVMTSSHMVPTIRGLWASLSSSTFASKVTDRLRTSLLKHLDRRFRSVESNVFFISATILDPRFKLLPWTSMDRDTGTENQVSNAENRCCACVSN